MRISYTIWCKEDRSLRRTIQRLREICRDYDEIIVADIGSTDPQVNQALAELPDRSIVLPSSSKISEARNAAMSAATGDIVVSMDADTWIPDGVIEQLEETFSNPNVTAVACDVRVYPWMENARDKALLQLLNLRFRLAFLIRQPCSRGEFQVFRNIGIRYNTNLYSGEDCEIMGRHAGHAVYLKHVQVYESPKRYRVNGHLRTFLMWSRDWFIVKLFGRSPPYITIPKE